MSAGDVPSYSSEREIALGDAYDDLDDRLDEYAGTLLDADEGTQGARAIQQMASEMETRLAGLSWLIHGDDETDFDGYGRDATVTLRKPDAGTYGRVKDRVADLRDSTDGNVEGAAGNVWAASCLADAPFLEDGADYETRLDAVTSLHPGVAKWLEAAGNDAVGGEGNFQSFSERLKSQSST